MTTFASVSFGAVYRLPAMAALFLAVLPGIASAQIADPVRVEGGLLSGVSGSDPSVRVFKGLPFAAPPVGDLRWKAPQPVSKWEGVRKADNFGSRPMQLPVFGDMVFRSEGMSEDCLYLNVWTPAKTDKERLPVLVYFYGGGFVGGDSSEPRYDGESMARKGIVAVTVNYRLGIFGFLAHPELTGESPHHASGNYGLLDQSAALQWVHKNIAAFGGDPKKITIGGESAGSFSVSAQMASPLSRKLLAGAIGESGAMLGQTLAAMPLEQAEKNGAAFGTEIGATSLSALRTLSSQQLLDATKSNPFRFGLAIDGYFLPRSARAIYTAGEQAHVPLLAGWNAEESNAGAVLGREPATLEGFSGALHTLYGSGADDALKVYGAANEAEVKQAATSLASARFIGYGTWKWTDLHAKTSGKPVYRYLYAHPRPGEGGAFHAVEIEYALGNLALNSHYAWTDSDRKVSATMQAYFANFIKTGNPNGAGLPEWPVATGGSAGQVMRLDVTSGAESDRERERYLFLDKVFQEKPKAQETIGEGIVGSPAVGPKPSFGIGGAGMVLVKNWHFGTRGTIKNYADMNANFVYHDQFNTIGNGTNYGAVTVAPDAANALPNQPIEGVACPPVRQFTADSLKTFLMPLQGATQVVPTQHNVGNGSFMAKWKLPNGGSLLGRDIVWETRVRYVTPPYFWFALWTAGNKWNNGAEQDLVESFGYDNGGGNTNYDGRYWHANSVAGKDTTDYGNWGKAMASHGIADYDASKYHIWTWLYKKDNSYAMYVDGVLVQSGSNYHWTYGSKETDMPIDMVFLFDGGWGHTQVASVNHALPAAAFTGKFYEWNYSRVYLSQDTTKTP